MADTQHNLRIKATLDTSQLQQEIDRLNQTGGQGSAGNGGAQSTTRILSKLDSTLTKLNNAIEKMSLAMQKASSGSASIGMPFIPLGQSGSLAINATFPRQKLTKHLVKGPVDWQRLIGISGMDPVTSAIAWENYASTREQMLQQAKAQRALLAAKSNPSAQELSMLHQLNLALNDRNTVQALEDAGSMHFQQMPNKSNRSFKRQLHAFGVGAISHMIGSQLNQFGQLAESGSTTQMVLQGTGNVLGAAGSGAMTGAAFGPYGAAAGAALAGLSQAAIEVSKAFQQLESKVMNYVENANKAYGSASTSLITASAQYRFNDLSQFNIGSYQDTVDALQKRRIGQLRQIKELTSGDLTEEDSENLKKLQQELAKTESELAAYESALATLMQRRAETSTEEEEAGKALARAEREFADALIAEERAIEQWHSDSQSNIKSYREAQRQHRDQMHQRDIQTAGFEREMDFQRSQAQIRLGMWRGGTAEDYFKDARTKRQSLLILNAARSHETDPQKLRQFNEDIIALQSEFQQTMMIGQLLKNLGNPLQKMQLGSLTSLANRGVNMGERTEMQRPYDKKMDEMVDLLQNIEENTRAAEKAIWE